MELNIKVRRCYEVWVEDEDGISYEDEMYHVYGTKKDAEEAGLDLIKEFKEDYGLDGNIKMKRCYGVWVEDEEKDQIGETEYVYGSKEEALERGYWMRSDWVDAINDQIWDLYK